jgi:hypothetical protein
MSVVGGDNIAKPKRAAAHAFGDRDRARHTPPGSSVARVGRTDRRCRGGLFAVSSCHLERPRQGLGNEPSSFVPLKSDPAVPCAADSVSVACSITMSERSHDARSYIVGQDGCTRCGGLWRQSMSNCHRQSARQSSVGRCNEPVQRWTQTGHCGWNRFDACLKPRGKTVRAGSSVR